MRLKTLLFIFFLAFSTQLIQAEESPLWLRYPAISPDGKWIAFCYKGDIYKVSADGGAAIALSISTAYDYMPVWSPDGKKIAFASNRYGNFDIFVIASEGGEAKRLTTHSGNERPWTFTPDSKNILFSASIMDLASNIMFPIGLISELYSVGTDGGRIKMVITTPAEEVRTDKSGNVIIYQDRKGYENIWRKHHTSSIARDIWMYNHTTGKHTKLSSFAGEDRNPVFSADGSEIYYLSEQFNSNFNVCKLSVANPQSVSQITKHDKHPVRFLTVANDEKLCYSYDGQIYTKTKTGQPVKLQLSITLDGNNNMVEYISSAGSASEMAVSPDGKEVIFVVRGEVYVASVESGVTKRITNTPEQERSVSFSPDGKAVLYASERGNSWGIYQTKLVRKEEKNFFNSTLLKEEVLLDTDAEEFQPTYSPDGKEVAYLEERTILKVYNLETKKSRLVLEGKYNYSYSDGDQWYEWSPDSKWFLVNYSTSHLFLSEIGLIDAEGKQLKNLTLNGYNDNTPRWMMGGKMMLWFTDRKGYRSHGSWGAENDVYGMFFTQQSFDNFLLSKEELEAQKDTASAKTDDKKDKKKVEPINIDFQGLEDRVMRLTINSSALSDAVLSADGEKLFYLSKVEKGYDLWVNNFREKETKLVSKISGHGSSLTLDKGGKNLFLLSDGKIIKISTDDYKQKTVSYSSEMNLDRDAERTYMFEHSWRQLLKKFYVADLHKVDWNFYKKEYSKFLPYINNNYDFAEMLSEMLGELNASHTGATNQFYDSNGENTGRLGVFFDESFAGDGLKILEIIDKSPLINSKSQTKAGMIIEKIDGMEIKANQDYFPLFNRKAGKNMLISVFDPASGKRWDELVKPISIGQENELLYQRWVENRRAEVEKLSNGRIGYVHVRGMDQPSFRDVYADVLGRNYDKEAIIIDTRFNGGGWLHDDLATLFSGKKYVDYVPRGQFFGIDPMSKWTKKTVQLIGESNYSDGHAFPYVYKTLGLGKLIGMPVPGTMTAVWWEQLQDQNIRFGIPQIGAKDLNNNYLENQQLEPDVKVLMEYEVATKGRDQQIEKAVEVMLKDLGQKK